MSRFLKWLSGEYRCIRCGRTWYSFGSFGFGLMICPKCYSGEPEFLFPDMTYWLNRLFSRRPRVEALEGICS